MPPKTMKAIRWDGRNYPEGLSYGNFPQPEIRPGWVKFRTLVCGICGSDLHYLHGIGRKLIPDKNFPAVLGHENAGVVVEVGDGVTDLKTGDRVAVEPIHSCVNYEGDCPNCRVGKYHLCKFGVTILGVPITRVLNGGYGEYSIAHASKVFKIPDNVSLEDAAMLDTLAVDVHSVKLAQPGIGDTVVVLGCGIIGLDLISCLKVSGVTDIIAVAKYGFQGDVAKSLGARQVIVLEEGNKDAVKEVMKLTGDWGTDQVYECVGGDSDALDQSISMVRKGGKVIMLGVFGGHRPLNLRMMLRKEVNLLCSDMYSTAGVMREFQIALNMLKDKQINHEALITHRYKPENFLEAIDVAMNKKKYQDIKTIFVRD